jgi:hypothetical protein
MKIKYRIITLLLVLIAFGCQTEDITSPAVDDNTAEIEEVSAQYDFDVEVKNDMLSFATRADYDKALEFLGPLQSEDFAVWEESLNFISLRASFTRDELDKRGIFDPLAATLMNPEYMIEIGNHIFVLDTKSETVSVVASSNFTNKLDLSAKNLTKYSVYDDVLDILEGTAEPEDLSSARRCRDMQRYDERFTVNGKRVDTKMRYQRTGWLKSLVANIKREGALFGSDATILGVRTSGSNYYRTKKDRRDIAFSANAGQGNRREYDIRPYYRSRKLHRYRFSVFFTITGSNGQDFSRTVWRSCN